MLKTRKGLSKQSSLKKAPLAHGARGESLHRKANCQKLAPQRQVCHRFQTPLSSKDKRKWLKRSK